MVSSWDVPQEGQTYRPKRMVLCRAMPWMAATWEAYWSDQGIIFQKTKKHSIPPFYHVVYDVFLHVLLGKMTLGHESRCSKITISWPVLGAWVWKFLPFLARRSLDFGAILVWAAFSRVNLRFFRFLQPASPKSTAILIFPRLFQGFSWVIKCPLGIWSIMATIRWCPIFPKWDSYQPLFFARVFMPFFVEFLLEVLVLRRAGDPQGDTELRRVGRLGSVWRYHPDAPCGTLW